MGCARYLIQFWDQDLRAGSFLFRLLGLGALTPNAAEDFATDGLHSFATLSSSRVKPGLRATAQGLGFRV